MKHNCIAILILCTFVAVQPRSDDGLRRDSELHCQVLRHASLEQLNDLSIAEWEHRYRTTTPIVPLHIFSSNPVGPVGYNPITMWVESAADNSQVPFTASQALQ